MPRTIEQQLQDAGYGHRRTESSTNTGRHEVYRLDTGRVVGYFSAVEALELVRKRPYTLGWQSVTR